MNRFGIRLLALGVVALMLTAAAWALAPARAQAEPADTITTTLYPDWNLVGWIHEDAEVSPIFAQLERLEAIFDGSGASVNRDQAELSGTLRQLQFGRGYWFLISAGHPVDWERDATAQDRVIDLGAGASLVAWTGGNATPFSNVVIGLDPQLVMAARWVAKEQHFTPWIPGLSKEHASESTLDRGEAIMLRMDAAKQWLHPTGTLPHVEFIGGLEHDHLRDGFAAVVERDLRHAIATLAGRGGLEINPEHYIVRITTTHETTFEHLGRDNYGGQMAPGFPRASGIPHMITMSWVTWDHLVHPDAEPYDTVGRSILAHEFFHVVQFDLRDPHYGHVPSWLVEGTTAWLNPEPPKYGTAIPRQLRSNTLDLSVHEDPARWEVERHALASVAIDLLLELVDHDRLLDFWQILGAGAEAGMTWQEAFDAAFGLTPPEFYDYFYQRRRGLFTQVSGEVSGWNGEDLSRLWVVATVSEDPDRISPPARIAEVNSDGSFVLNLPRGEPHDLAVERRFTNCRVPLGIDGRVDIAVAPLTIVGKGESHESIRAIVPETFCATTVTIELPQENVSGEQLSTLVTRICATDVEYCVSGWRASESTYKVILPVAGEYVIAFDKHRQDCPSYWDGARIVHTQSAAKRYQFGDGAYVVQLARLDLDQACHLAVRGYVSIEDVEWNGDVRWRLMESLPNEDGIQWGQGDEVGPGGYFVATAGAPGPKTLDFTVHRERQGTTRVCTIRGSNEEQWLERQTSATMKDGAFFVGPGSAVTIDWKARPDACRWWIGAVVTNYQGEPLGQYTFGLCRRVRGLEHCQHTATDEGGRFLTLAEGNGEYWLQPLYRYPDGRACHAGFDSSFHREVVINGSDVVDVVWALPERLCEG